MKTTLPEAFSTAISQYDRDAIIAYSKEHGIYTFNFEKTTYDSSGRIIPHSSILFAQALILQSLLDHEPHTAVSIYQHVTPEIKQKLLVESARSGLLTPIIFLHTQGTDLLIMEPREYDGLICNNNILLSWAANFNHLDVLRYLVAQPGIVTKTSTKSALFNAVHLGYVEAVRLILTHGGDSLYAKSLLRSLQSNSLMEEVIHHGLEREAISLKTPLLDKRHIVRL